MHSKRIRVREPFCGLSHLVGAALSVAALIVLLLLSHGRVRPLLGFALYGGSLIFLYTSSTLYHSLNVDEKQLDRWNQLDYIGIFLLIAGTYAPVCLIALRGAWGWSLLGAEYGLAALGIALLLFWKSVPHWVRLALYLCMGWLAVLAWPLLRAAISLPGLAWLVAGGVVYTVGCVIYAADRPHLWPGKFGAHELWHLFVLAGSGCHFVMMVCYIAPMAGTKALL